MKEQLKSEKISDAERAEYLHYITQIIRNNDEIVSAVYRTTDYDKFKTLDGNRTVEKSRVNKILKSINDNGYIHCPIIVNERMEIIDGQGRLEAVKQLGIPVEYKKADKDKCLATLLSIYPLKLDSGEYGITEKKSGE
ncbi:ParB N-terminal domain-containing protein [bacterium]|nr:ParB N-terminal domain-containing protein [bacterium]